MKVAIIGGGAMGGAIAQGLLTQSRADVEVSVSNPSQAPLERLGAMGAETTHDNNEALHCADVVIIAVKPWLVEQVMAGLDLQSCPGATLVSVAAGIGSEKLRALTADAPVAPVMAIPNIAAAYGESMTFVSQVDSPEAVDAAVEVFDLIGATIVVPERLLGAGMTMASCGIAYALRYIRAAVEGGVELGIKAADGQKIVAQTVIGAATLLQQPGAHAEAEIDKVTTPGGVTIKGLNEMEAAGFTSAVIRGLKAALR